MSLLVHLFPSTTTPVVPSFGWMRPLEIPTRRIRRTPEYPHLFRDTLPVVSFAFFRGLDEPVRRKRRTPEYEDYTVDIKPIVPFSWFQGLRDPYLPTRKRQHTTVLSSASGNTYLVPVFDSVIFSNTISSAEPTFTKTVLYQAYALDPYVSPAIPGESDWFPDKWYQPFSEPKRFKKSLSAGSQLFLSFYTNPVVTFSYFQGLNEPKRFNSKLKSAWLPFIVLDPYPFPNPPAPPYSIPPFTGTDLIGAHEYFPWHNRESLTGYFNKSGHGRKGYFPTDKERQDVLVRKRQAIENPTTIQELDWDVYNFFDVTLNNDATFVFSNPRDNSDFVILLTKDSNSNIRNITWPASLAWPDNDSFTSLSVSGESKLIRISYFGNRYRVTLY